jgi:hypothetical protein
MCSEILSAMAGHERWGQRLMGSSTGMPLGFIAELWRRPDAWVGLDRAVQRAREKGRKVDGYTIFAATTEQLLREVVHTAQAILYTAEKVQTAVGHVQRWAERELPSLKPDEPWPEYGWGIGHPQVVAAGIEFVNLLSWLRGLEERLSRRALSGDGQVGLLPMLNPHHPITERVHKLAAELRKEAFGDRRLANLVLHHEAVPQGQSGAEWTRDRRVVIRLPDPLDEPVDFPFELTYAEQRDLLTISENIVGAVTRFVDTLLDHFEEANRMRKRGEIPPH